MITIEKARLGICRYVEKELAEKETGLGRWNASFLAVPLSRMFQEKFLEIRDIAQRYGYMTEDGLIDIDRLYKEYHEVASRMGATIHHLPLLGDVEFNAEDVTCLYRYMVH